MVECSRPPSPHMYMHMHNMYMHAPAAMVECSRPPNAPGSREGTPRSYAGPSNTCTDVGMYVCMVYVCMCVWGGHRDHMLALPIPDVVEGL